MEPIAVLVAVTLFALLSLSTLSHDHTDNAPPDERVIVADMPHLPERDVIIVDLRAAEFAQVSTTQRRFPHQ